MNILFTTSAAPKISPFSTKEKRPPLGVGSLISVTRNAGHKAFFIDNYLKPSNFIEKGYLQKKKIDIVGIHSNTICFRDTLRMIKEIDNLRKKGQWKGKIVIGGPHTSVALETIPKCVDHVVQGEGEKAILKIINDKAKKRVIREERIKNIDHLPFEPWDVFSKLSYDYSCPWMDIKPVYTMNTSRGCPFRCAFCSVDSIWGSKYVHMSAKRIIDEIKFLIKKYGAKGIYFREDNFTLDLKRTEEFCRALIKEKINIIWACETRVSNLTKELIKLMGKAGCRAVYLGVENGSQRILDLLNKNITVEQIKNVITWCKKYHIRTYCSLITGVPGETFKDYQKTQQLMYELKPYHYSYNVFVGIPTSILYYRVLQDKLYEHIDDVGLVYLPGYDIRTKFFYGKDSRDFVDFKFQKRTDFDKRLLKEIYKRKIKKVASIFGYKEKV